MTEWRHSLAVQIAEVEREIRKRTQVYPRQVAQDKMRQREADELIRIMQSVLQSLHLVEQLRDEVALWKDRHAATEQALAATINDFNKAMQEP